MRSHCEAGLDSLSSVDFRNSVAKAQFDCPVFFCFCGPVSMVHFCEVSHRSVVSVRVCKFASPMHGTMLKK